MHTQEYICMYIYIVHTYVRACVRACMRAYIRAYKHVVLSIYMYIQVFCPARVRRLLASDARVKRAEALRSGRRLKARWKGIPVVVGSLKVWSHSGHRKACAPRTLRTLIADFAPPCTCGQVKYTLALQLVMWLCVECYKVCLPLQGFS